MPQSRPSLVLGSLPLALGVALTFSACAPPTSAAAEGPSPNPLKNVYWGDTHLHTRNSPDAYFLGNSGEAGPEVAFVDDKAAKPVAINRHIGRRPIAAFGNSDGDLQMLQYATGGDRSGLAVLVHHDDAEREYAYDRGSKIGGLDKAWDEAEARGWTVVSMKNDWRTIFPSSTDGPKE